MESSMSPGHYENLKPIRRRGPLITMARLWSAVPIPPTASHELLPEPHQTFIGFFVHIFLRDGWVIVDYDGERWGPCVDQILADERALSKLSAFELQDLLTFCYRCDHHDPRSHYLNELTRSGYLQRALFRLATLVSGHDY